jgi:hypothetical protein
MAQPLTTAPTRPAAHSGLKALTWDDNLERVTGIEPALSAWEADVLPLNYTRAGGSRPQQPPGATGPDCHRPDIVPDPDRCQRRAARLRQGTR